MSFTFFKLRRLSAVAAPLLVALVVGCKGEAEPVSSATSSFEVDEGEETTSDALADRSASSSASEDGADAHESAADLTHGGAVPRSAGRDDADGAGAALADRASPKGSGRAGGETGRKSVTSQPPTVASEELNAIEVPDGEPAEIQAFLEQLALRRPQGTTPEEMMADVRRILKARVLAAERLLEKSDNEETRMEAAMTKFSSLGTLAERLDDREAAKELEKFAEAIRNDKAPKVAQLGRLASFGMMLQRWQADPNHKPDAVINGLKELLSAGDLDSSVFEIAGQTPALLASESFTEEAKEAQQLVQEAFKDSSTPEIVAQLARMKEEARFHELNVMAKVEAFNKEGDAKLPDLMEAARTMLTAENAGALTFDVMSQLAQLLESSHQYSAALELYESMGKTFGAHSDPKLVEASKQVAESGVTRMGLIGKPLPVEGVLAGGDPFTWESYKGKYVLVDFWATWCGPCLKELPNIRANYEKYREHGFDVVGVNIDQDRKAAIKFAQDEKLPWATVLSAEGEQGGDWTHPNVKRCGISAIPFLALVDPAGNVVELHLRGEELGKKLAELFPNAEGAATEGKTGAFRATGDKTWFVGLGVDDEQDQPEAEEESEADPEQESAPTEGEGDAAADEVNPYSPSPGMTPEQLVQFIFAMQDKPKSIQSRPGFSEAIVEATDMLLSAGAPEKYRNLAVLTKLDVLHKQASLGSEPADAALVAYVEELRDEKSEKIARDLKFFQLERKVLQAKDAPLDQLPALFTELKEFFSQQRLTARHLRIASATVEAINRLEDGPEREKLFEEFGKMFAASHDKDLALYGKKLVKNPEGEQSDVVGKPLELAGVTAQGTEFDWASYRGKVVLVDFWATWCGPCRQEMPNVKALYERLKDRGLDVVGVSLDQDQDALAAYLEENAIPWSTLAGEKTQELAGKYGVRGIPTMMLVGKDGLVAAVSHRVEDLAEKAGQLLGDVAAKESDASPAKDPAAQQ